MVLEMVQVLDPIKVEVAVKAMKVGVRRLPLDVRKELSSYLIMASQKAEDNGAGNVSEVLFEMAHAVRIDTHVT